MTIKTKVLLGVGSFVLAALVPWQHWILRWRPLCLRPSDLHPSGRRWLLDLFARPRGPGAPVLRAPAQHQWLGFAPRERPEVRRGLYPDGSDGLSCQGLDRQGR